MVEERIIKNWDELATNEKRRLALELIEAGIKRVLPSSILQSSVSYEPKNRDLQIKSAVYHLDGRLFVIGAGKASGLMAQTLEALIGAENIEAGLVIDKADPAEFKTIKIKVIRAGHPLPDQRGLEAVQEMLHLKDKYSIEEKDLVLCLLSGGGSALMPYPLNSISLDEKQQVTHLLLSSGANIREINSVRKHLSRVKGGRLAQHFAPANVVSLILSDVIGNDLSVIASGPTFPDSSTFSEAYTVLKKYHILAKTPVSISSILEKGRRGEIEETPKSLGNVSNYIIGDIRIALKAMQEKARASGLNPLIISSEQQGDTLSIAQQRAQEILEGVFSEYNALLIGGETTPKLPAEPGKGGRNQHYAALTPLFLEHYPGDWVMASVDTDGSDFIPNVAGAIVDHQSLGILKQKVPEYRSLLEKYDSYNLLTQVSHTLIITGDTHTNVGDIIVYLI